MQARLSGSLTRLPGLQLPLLPHFIRLVKRSVGVGGNFVLEACCKVLLAYGYGALCRKIRSSGICSGMCQMCHGVTCRTALIGSCCILHGSGLPVCELLLSNCGFLEHLALLERRICPEHLRHYRGSRCSNCCESHSATSINNDQVPDKNKSTCCSFTTIEQPQRLSER